MKLFYEYMVIFLNFSPTSNQLYLLQVENCDSNSRLVVDEDDNDKFRPDRAKHWGYPSKHTPLTQYSDDVFVCWDVTFFAE